MVINDKIIHAFSPNSALSQSIDSACYEEYSSLVRAVRRAKFLQCDEVLYIGDAFKPVTEFYNYSSNMIILCEIENKFVFQLMCDGKVGPEIIDINDQRLKDMFVLKDYNVIDNYGKEISVHSYQMLVNYLKDIKTARNHFEKGKNAYHMYMEKLFQFRKVKKNYPNNQAGDVFSTCLSLGDEFGKELRDILTDEYFNCERKISQLHHIPSDKKKLATIFGLYLACLKSYALDDDMKGTSMSYDFALYCSFLREYNYFLQKHSNILEEYANEFSLQPCYKEQIHLLLKEQHLDGNDWKFDNSNIQI